jgi:8-oxo-dGTP diphosphatase
MTLNKVKINKLLNLETIYENVINQYETIVLDFIICSEDNTKILAQKRSATRKFFPNCWEFTGGKLEKGETILECIIREMKEESDMELVEILGLAHQFIWSTDPSVINIQFLVKAKGEFKPEEGKISEYRWVAKDDISILTNGEEGESQIYKGAFYAFGFLESLKTNFTQDNFSFASYLDEVVSKFYLDKGIKSLSPKIVVENLPEGLNIQHTSDNNILKVDVKIITGTNLFFIAIVVLHDLYHNLKQGISSHDEVLLVRDVFDYSTMLLMDIDADLEIYKFFVKYYDFNFQKYIETLYQGGDVFRNTIARMPKMQRFLGSMMSIYHLGNSNQKVIYFPNLTKIHDKIFVLAISDGIKFNQLQADHKEVEIVIDTFQNSNKYTK